MTPNKKVSPVTGSIIGIREIYTYLFSKEGVDSLIAYNVVNKNTPSVYLYKITMRGRLDFNDSCSFVVKDYSGEARKVEGKTFSERLDRFKNLDFETLFEFKYLERRKRRR